MNEVGPHVRGAFPWLRSGPLWRMHVDAAPALDDFLAENDFVRLDLDGRLLTSRQAAHNQGSLREDDPDVAAFSAHIGGPIRVD